MFMFYSYLTANDRVLLLLRNKKEENQFKSKKMSTVIINTDDY